MIERDLESTDLASAAYLAAETGDHGDALEADLPRPRRVPPSPYLDPENAPDPCEIGEHPDQEDGYCLACGEYVRAYPEDW
jgi:hypothetical protein